MEAEIQNMRAAMEESQRTYELEKIASQAPEKAQNELTETDISVQYASSDMIPLVRFPFKTTHVFELVVVPHVEKIMSEKQYFHFMFFGPDM